METKSITIDIPKGKTIEWRRYQGRDFILLKDEKANMQVIERIKTFDDAKTELGDSHPLVVAYNSISGFGDPDTIVYLKLKIITAALNEGWVRTPYDLEAFYPGFELCSEEEADDCGYKKMWSWGGSSDFSAPCAIACRCALSVWSYSSVHTSPLLAYKTIELAAYSFKQFNDLWADYLLPHPIQKV